MLLVLLIESATSVVQPQAASDVSKVLQRAQSCARVLTEIRLWYINSCNTWTSLSFIIRFKIMPKSQVLNILQWVCLLICEIYSDVISSENSWISFCFQCTSRHLEIGCCDPQSDISKKSQCPQHTHRHTTRKHTPRALNGLALLPNNPSLHVAKSTELLRFNDLERDSPAAKRWAMTYADLGSEGVKHIFFKGCLLSFSAGCLPPGALCPAPDRCV